MTDIPKAAVEAAASDIWRNVEWYAAASPENVAEEIIQAALPHLDGYAAGFAAGVEAMRQLVREEWHAAVKNHGLRPGSPTEAVVAAILNRSCDISPPAASPWRPIAEAKKDSQATIWAIFRDDIYPVLRPERPDLERWNGVQVPLRHPGLAEDGFDVGWSIAAPVGNGGFPDEWIAGWMPLPLAPGGTE